MAVTSGTYNVVSLLAQDVVTAAMKRCRQLPAGGTPSVDDLTDCILELNNLMKLWETQGYLLWLMEWIGIPEVQNQIVYTLGPPDGDFPDYRPLRLCEGCYIRQTCGASSPQDTVLYILSRTEYAYIGNKSSLGVTNSIYYDPQMGLASYNPATAKGKLYVYVGPSDSTRTIFLNVHRPIQDITSAGQTFDFPKEWYYALVKCLAAEIADLYEVPEDRIRRIKQEGEQALQYIADWGTQEMAPIYMKPDPQMFMR